MSASLTPGRAAVVPVVLCGGAGTRLWPASTAKRPKQFLDLFGDGVSLFRATLDRMAALGLSSTTMVVCGAAQAALVREQAGPHAIDTIIEPVGRNTAPAIALAALTLPGDAVMLVCPSDHRIADVAAFGEALDRALEAARDGWMVTFGIMPDHPETGYGYIRRGAPLAGGAYRVDKFIEKPSADLAGQLVASGIHDWNAGLFLMRADAVVQAMDTHCPDIIAAVRAAILPDARADDAAFAAVPAMSIDYAVMERSDRVATVPVTMGWSDVGGWRAVHDLSPRDHQNNAAPSTATLIDAAGCLVRSDGPRVSILGLDEVAVVVDGDDIAIFPLSRAQDVRQLAAGQSVSNRNGDAPRS